MIAEATLGLMNIARSTSETVVKNNGVLIREDTDYSKKTSTDVADLYSESFRINLGQKKQNEVKTTKQKLIN